MEIERKYLISSLPEHLDQYPHRQLEQGYLSTSPVVRVRNCLLYTSDAADES